MTNDSCFDEHGHLVAKCWCGATGHFGFGVNLQAGKTGEWRCAEHKDMPAPDDADLVAPSPEPNRHFVELPDSHAIARWPRSADVPTIVRCILGTLKYEPHTNDTTTLQDALRALLERSEKAQRG